MLESYARQMGDDDGKSNGGNNENDESNGIDEKNQDDNEK